MFSECLSEVFAMVVKCDTFTLTLLVCLTTQNWCDCGNKIETPSWRMCQLEMTSLEHKYELCEPLERWRVISTENCLGDKQHKSYSEYLRICGWRELLLHGRLLAWGWLIGLLLDCFLQQFRFVHYGFSFCCFLCFFCLLCFECFSVLL